MQNHPAEPLVGWPPMGSHGTLKAWGSAYLKSVAVAEAICVQFHYYEYILTSVNVTGQTRLEKSRCWHRDSEQPCLLVGSRTAQIEPCSQVTWNSKKQSEAGNMEQPTTTNRYQKQSCLHSILMVSWSCHHIHFQAAEQILRGGAGGVTTAWRKSLGFVHLGWLRSWHHFDHVVCIVDSYVII